MALNNLGLGFTFTAKDLATPTMNRVEGRFRRLDKTTGATSAQLQQGFGALRASGLAIGLAGGLALRSMKGAADAAGKFEQSIAKVGAISRASADDLKLLEQAAIKAGIETQFSPQEAAEGLGDLAVQGFNAHESIALLNPALNLAAGGQISVADAAKTTSAAVKVFGLSMDEAALAADQLLKISNVTALSANDLQLALGTVGRGATAAKQSIEEMLPSIGLVKNTGVDASVAASSVSSALVSMAKNAKKFDKLGVSVTDANGKFRPFLDIVQETNGALSGIKDEAERAAKATDLFGRFGQTAFSAISNQLTNGIKNANGQIITGVEAIEFLRQSMVGAEGTAEEFKRKLLDTFEGQKTLLKGSLDTLKITFGKAFASTLRPIVEKTIKLVNTLIEKFQSMPDSMKETIARLALIAGVVTTATGAGSAFLGILGAMRFGIGALGLSLGVVLKVLLPIAAAVLLVIGAVKLFRFAMERNLGGIRDFLGPIFDKISLFFRALGQLFTKGFVTGDVLEDLKKVENEGVLKLLGAIVRLGFRVKNFVEGFIGGFRRVLETMGPTFRKLVEAMERFGKAIGIGGDEFDKFASGPSKRFLKAGEAVGEFFGNLVDIIVNAVAIYINTYAAAIEFFKQGLDFLRPVFDELVSTFTGIVAKLDELASEFGFTGGAMEALGAVFEAVGSVIGFVWTAIVASVTIAATAIGKVWSFMIDLILILVRAFKAAKEGVIAAWDGVVQFFRDVAQGISDAINSMIDLLAQVAEAIPDAIRPDVVDDFLASRRKPLMPQIAAAATAATASAQAGPAGPNMEAFAAQIAEKLKDGVKVDVKIGEETVAKAARRGQRADDAGTFGGTPSLGED